MFCLASWVTIYSTVQHLHQGHSHYIGFQVVTAKELHKSRTSQWLVPAYPLNQLLLSSFKWR